MNPVLFRMSGKVVGQVDVFERNQHVVPFQHPDFGDRLIYLYNVYHIYFNIKIYIYSLTQFT